MFTESLEQNIPVVTFAVKLVPRAKHDEIVGIENDALKIRVNAPPVDGRANEALLQFLARTLKVARSQVELARGETSRHKLVRVRGVTAARVREILNNN